MRRRYRFALLAACAVVVAIMLLWPDVRSGGNSGEPWSGPQVDRDLDEIKHDTLRVLVIEQHLVYERIAGAETGLEYELLKRIASVLGVPVKAIPVANGDSLLSKLQRGEGDVIAAMLSAHSPWSRWIASTMPYRYVSPVFVTLRPDAVLDVPASPENGPDTA